MCLRARRRVMCTCNARLNLPHWGTDRVWGTFLPFTMYFSITGNFRNGNIAMVLVILRKKANKKTKGRQARSWWLILSEVTWEPLFLNEPFLPQVWETIKVYSTSLPFLPWRPALKIASQRPTLTTHMNSQLLSRSEDMYMWELTHKFIWTHKTCALLTYCLLITHLSLLSTVTQTTIDHKISRNPPLSRGCLWESFVSADTGFFDGFLLLQLIVSVKGFF